MEYAMTREELKARAVQAVEDAKDELIAIGRKLQSMPEPGYREVKTSGFLADQLRKCGLAVEQGLAFDRTHFCVECAGEAREMV